MKKIVKLSMECGHCSRLHAVPVGTQDKRGHPVEDLQVWESLVGTVRTCECGATVEITDDGAATTPPVEVAR